MKPPAKPPSSSAARPTPLTMAAYSLRVKPRSMTKGAVIAPDSASVNLNSTTKASIDEGELVAHEILEGADGGFGHARERLLHARASASAAAERVRLGGEQRRDDADQHQHGHRRNSPSARPPACRSRRPGSRSPGTARRRSRPACRRGRPRRRRPCRRPARFPAGSRRGRRRPRCPAWRRRSPPAARRSATRPGALAGSQEPRKTIAAISSICVNTSQPRRRPSRRDSSGTSSASISGAHRNLIV